MSTPISPTPAAPTTRPPVPTLFPPSFLDVVDLSFQAILGREHPDLSIDTQNTWLNLYQGTSLWLRDSLIDVFLGRLTLADQDRLGWFTAADTVADADRIPGLAPQQIQALYTQLSDNLIKDYNTALLEYWEVVETDGKSRRTLFLAEFLEALRLEARAGVEQRTLTTSQAAMLETVLRYSQDQNPDALQQHGIYSLSLSKSQQAPMEMAGCFVLSHVCNVGAPEVSDGRMGVVVLYTPNRGLEGFASLPALSESLSQRLADPTEKWWLLKNTDLASANTVEDNPTPSQGRIAHNWNYIPMGGNFLSVQFIRQRSKQASDFTHCVEIAKARKLDQPAFLALLDDMLDPRYQFDNYLNLDRNERNIVHACMPDAWRDMSSKDKTDWLVQAKTYGGSIVELQLTTEEQRKNPELDSKAFLDAYVHDTLKTLLRSRHITLSPSSLVVEMTYESWPVPVAFPSPTFMPDSSNNKQLVSRSSLKALALEKPDRLKLDYVQTIVVKDANNAPVPQLNAEVIKALLKQIDLEGAFERFLTERLKTSAYGQHLHAKSDQLTLAHMRLGWWAAKHSGFEPVGLRWISAVLDAPKTSNRQPLTSAGSPTPEAINIRFMKINDTPLSNVMLITPASTQERRAMVVCTLNAPDGVVFRWFSSTAAFRRGLLNNGAFTEYLLLQLPVTKRPAALTSIEADLWLRQYRFPAVFKYQPQIVPLPGLLWELETYTEPSPDFLAQNHRIKIEHMISDATLYWDQSRTQPSPDYSALAQLAISVALLFLPTPVMIPVALGMGLYAAWEGFRSIEEHDYQGAAGELLIALGYLVPAGIGKWSLSQELASPISAARPSPPLVRTLGPDGQPRIGYLLSHSGPPRLGGTRALTPFNTANFSSVDIDDEVFLVSKHFNLFGHAKLYRQSKINPKVLVHSGEYAQRSKTGVWLKAPYRPRGTGPHIYRQAARELESLTLNWPTSAADLSLAEKARFESDFMKLANTSNTAFMPDVLSYCEAGSAEFNQLLRAGTRNTITHQFLRQFYQLNDYQGMAFRVTHVSAAGLQRLKSRLGLNFSDKGVQSASVSRFNAAAWSQEQFITQHATPDNQLVFMVFDKSVPKKNLFSHLLGDHVGVAPGTPMQLTASQETAGHSFFYFTSPQDLGNELFDVYSGEREILV
jgi:hypothetical protein